MFPTGIVVHSTRYYDGTILEGAQTVARARDEGALVLPYESGREGEFLGGYFRRGWGEWKLDRLVGQRICPMLVRVEPERPWLYWAASIVIDEGSGKPSGSLRLVSDTSYPGAQATAISAGQDDILLERLDWGKSSAYRKVLYVGGKRRISVAQPGFLALNLYATATGASVLVSAVAQAAVDVAYP